MNNAGYFITATDTGVGKTVVTAGLARAFRQQGYSVGVMKPIVAGSTIHQPGSDTRLLSQSVNQSIPLELITPVALKLPFAPLIAARLEHKRIAFPEIFSVYKKLKKQFEILLVEGAGGLLVPLGRRNRGELFYIADLIKEMDIPLIIVTHPYLGTINHTLLTIKIARQWGLKVRGVVINHCLRPEVQPEGRGDTRTRIERRQLILLREIIQEGGKINILGEIPYLGKHLNPERLSLKPFNEIIVRLLSL